MVASLSLAALTGACATSGGGNGAPPAPAPAANTLTPEEVAAGWRLLFDGATTKGWRNFKKPTFPERGWHVVNGVLKHEKKGQGPKAGDIITEEQFDNFELSLEFQLTPRGNSGIKYLVDEQLVPEGKSAVSFEFQILDDALHPDANKGKDGNRRCGGLYDLIAPAPDKIVKPIGEWNHARLVVDGNNIEHWLNGKKTVSFVRGSPELKALIAESKFKETVGFGEAAKGHILLQDHDDEIGFRNIKIRPLPARVAATP